MIAGSSGRFCAGTARDHGTARLCRLRFLALGYNPMPLSLN
jgi:hypothetical protein